MIKITKLFIVFYICISAINAKELTIADKLPNIVGKDLFTEKFTVKIS